jgi:hypothetical protein
LLNSLVVRLSEESDHVERDWPALARRLDEVTGSKMKDSTVMVWLVLSSILGVAMIASLLYLQYRILADCGLLAAVHGAEIYWLFGGCK